MLVDQQTVGFLYTPSAHLLSSCNLAFSPNLMWGKKCRGDSSSLDLCYYVLTLNSQEHAICLKRILSLLEHFNDSSQVPTEFFCLSNIPSFFLPSSILQRFLLQLCISRRIILASFFLGHLPRLYRYLPSFGQL